MGHPVACPERALDWPISPLMFSWGEMGQLVKASLPRDCPASSRDREFTRSKACPMGLCAGDVLSEKCRGLALKLADVSLELEILPKLAIETVLGGR